MKKAFRTLQDETISQWIILILLLFMAGCNSNPTISSKIGRPSISAPIISSTPIPKTPSTPIPPPSKTPTSSPFYTATIQPLPTTSPLPTPTTTSPSLTGIWRCWDDGSPDPCHRHLGNITFLSDDDGWIVGDHGAILHWDGEEWKVVTNPSNLELDRIVAISSDQAWAVGAPWSSRHDNKRTLLRWDGKTWSIFTNSTSLDFIGPISFVNENDGWAIVNEAPHPSPASYLAHWDGKAWIKVIDTPPLYDIKMVSPNDGWAVGKSGVMYRWDGQSWQVYRSPATTDRWITNLSFVSENEGWAIVDYEAVIRWNGSEWQEVPFPDEIRPLQIIMASSTYGWIIGDDETNYFQLIRWDGQSWNLLKNDQLLIPDDSTAVIAALPNGEAWGVFSYGDSQIWHWNESSWQPYKPTKLPRVTAMDFVSPSEAWIVGEEGYIAHWDSNQLKQIPNPAVATLNDIAFLSSDNGWAVGEGDQILHWDGHTWNVVRDYHPPEQGPAQTSFNFHGIAFSNPNDGWAVGSMGTEGGGYNYMLHWNGKVWEDQSETQKAWECALTSVALLDQHEGWATGNCGGEGGLLHWDGEKWQSIQNPDNYWLYSASILSPGNTWAVGAQLVKDLGDQGIVLHWDGYEWTENIIVPCSLRSILMVAENDGWMISECGEIYHWNGISWQNGSDLVSGPFIDIEVTSEGKIWLLTYDGALLYSEK
jgi:photosystem II stability/assembly factor-like uncharacterized protein